jgi:enediyne biosynthesis protein E3
MIGRAISAARRRILKLQPEQASFAVRNFSVGSLQRQSALETTGETFIAGYNAAITAETLGDIAAAVARTPEPLRGFAAEGAGMAAAMVDALSVRGSRLKAVLGLFEREFTYLAHVGAGWAIARAPWRKRSILGVLDPVHGWLAYDGLGFHDCYFHSVKVLAGWRRETSGYAARAYDQGVGRALWFVSGGSVELATLQMRRLDGSRAADLAAGLGLAMAYAGPNEPEDFAPVLRFPGAKAAAFCQGVAFACEARARAGHIPKHTRTAAAAVGFEAEALAGLVREARESLAEADGETSETPRYEQWRHHVSDAIAVALERRA